MSLGIRSGVNWMRLKSSDSDCASEWTISVLARPGHALQDAVSAGEDGDQQLLDDVVLPDDLPGDLLADLVVGRAQLAPVRRGRVSSVVVGAQDRVPLVISAGRPAEICNGSCRMIAAMAVP